MSEPDKSSGVVLDIPDNITRSEAEALAAQMLNGWFGPEEAPKPIA